MSDVHNIVHRNGYICATGLLFHKDKVCEVNKISKFFILKITVCGGMRM